MKSVAQLVVFGLLMFNLFVGHQAGLFLVRNGVIYCKLSTRGSCDKSSPLCVKIMSANPTCKYYKSECHFVLDNCLRKTQYGRLGQPTIATDCNAIPVGLTGNC